MSVWWSIALTSIAVYVVWQLGNKRTHAFLVGAAAQVGWLAYAIVGAQYGFVVAAVVFFGLNLRNWLKWKREEKTA